jgi:hypothetical protein
MLEVLAGRTEVVSEFDMTLPSLQAVFRLGVWEAAPEIDARGRDTLTCMA